MGFGTRKHLVTRSDAKGDVSSEIMVTTNTTFYNLDTLTKRLTKQFSKHIKCMVSGCQKVCSFIGNASDGVCADHKNQVDGESRQTVKAKVIFMHKIASETGNKVLSLKCNAAYYAISDPDVED